ncbi:uncharacterized protein LOC131593666 [Vicia villosa]|uniref:uncharacterized protein LOC131593666 n=1 Tax=Vicia villosa TaxID=3911 RepID=UPI00273BC2DB|nr:uncharacterized protein LOC131593666 [Vicia villosa]
MKRKNIGFYKSSFLLTKNRRKKTSSKPDFYLPEDCWEHVFTFVTNHKRDFNSLSLVSKMFLSITNRLLFSLRIPDPQPCFLRRIFHRFSNLNFLDLQFNLHHDLDADIALTLRDIPTLKSLSISNIDLKDGKFSPSLLIDSLFSLKRLISLKFWDSKLSDDLLYSIAREALPLKSFVIKYCTCYTYNGLYCLLSKCNSIQHLGLQQVDFLDNHYITDLSLHLPHLVSINLSQCYKLTESALFVLLRNCHSLEEIIMEDIDFRNFDSFKNFHVNSQLKSLCLAGNFFINDESIIMLVSIFPNLQLLDLNGCDDISGKVPQLEVLNLSYTRVDDKTLYEVSKSCHGLLQLKLAYCNYVTKKGMIHVVENCTKLKEIDLRYCNKVEAYVVVSKVLSRSSLKKRKLFSRDGRIFFS